MNIENAISELHKAFFKLNNALFNNGLPEPAILIQNRGNKKNVLGWCSTKEIWENAQTKETKYEINIVAEYLNRSIYDIMGTLLHEMIHLHNLINGIKDVTRSYTYHNKRFKEVAEEHGLIVEYDKKIGWSLTRLQETTKELIQSFKLNEQAFALFRVDVFDIKGKGENQEEKGGGEKRKSSYRRYLCPQCGTIIRATKDVNIICAQCNIAFIKTEKDEDD